MDLPQKLKWHLEAIGYSVCTDSQFINNKPSPRQFLLERLRKSLNKHSWQGPKGDPVEIHVGVISSARPEVTALTTRIHDIYFIGIMEPVFSAIIEIIIALTGHMTFGDERETEVRSLPAEEAEEGTKGKAVRATLYGVPRPEKMKISDGHLVFASFLQRFAIEFLYYHELQHILLGHLGRREIRHSSPTLVERAASTSRKQSEDRAMEFYADFGAASTMAHCCMNNSFVLCPSSLIPHDQLSTQSFAEHLLMSLLVVYIVFEAHEQRKESPSASYPAVAVRALTAVEAFAKQFKAGTQSQNLDMNSVWEGAIANVFLGLSRSGYKNPILSWFSEIKDIDHYYGDYAEIVRAAEEFRPLWTEHQIRSI